MMRKIVDIDACITYLGHRLHGRFLHLSITNNIPDLVTSSTLRFVSIVELMRYLSLVVKFPLRFQLITVFCMVACCQRTQYFERDRRKSNDNNSLLYRVSCNESKLL